MGTAMTVAGLREEAWTLKNMKIRIYIYYIYIYTSVDPCIYMHGARRAEQRGAEHSVSRVQHFRIVS